MTIETWLVFSSIALIATLSPGPAILLVTTHSISHGLRRSVATMLGNITGLFVMSALSVLGLSAIVLHSPSVFIAVKYIGAVYLVYLGLRLWRRGFGSPEAVTRSRTPLQAPPSGKRLYAQGLLVAASNPKAIAFVTALFPQFIDHTQPVLAQFGILVATFMALSFSCLFGYGYASVTAKHRVSGLKASRHVSKVFGIAFVISGIFLANAPQKQA